MAKVSNIVLLRSLAILAILAHHCIAAFYEWPPNHEIGGDLPAFAVLAQVSAGFRSFGLGLFTLISGYVLYYQKRKKDSFLKFTWKKVKRILIPCILVGMLYVLIFPTFMFDYWPAFINGTHLWYLPMLLACILVSSSFFYLGSVSWYLIAAVYLAAVIGGRFTDFRTVAEYVFYFPFFFMGFLINKQESEAQGDKKHDRLVGIALAVLFSVVVVYAVPTRKVWLEHLVLSLACYYLIRLIWHNRPLHPAVSHLSKASFDIYLVHQFVINAMIALFIQVEWGFYCNFTLLFVAALFIPWVLSGLYDFLVATVSDRRKD